MMRNTSDKSCRENQNTHFVFNNTFFFENHVVYEIMWKNTVERDKPQMTIWRMGIAYWITEAKNTHIQHVIRSASPQKQFLQEDAFMLRYTCIAI
jgi:hypothetical protein